MSDRKPPQLPAPAFRPVPRKCQRHDGWTPERQRDFIAALAETGVVRAAADRVGMATEGAYALRRTPGAESFAAAWDEALDQGARILRDIAIERALQGVLVPVYSYGKLIGERRIFNDRLLMFCVKNNIGRLGGDDPRPRLLPRGTQPLQARRRETGLTPEAEATLRARWWEEEQPRLAGIISSQVNALSNLATLLSYALMEASEARNKFDEATETLWITRARNLQKVLLEQQPEWEDRAMMAMLEFSVIPKETRAILGTDIAYPLKPGPTLDQRAKVRIETMETLRTIWAKWEAAGNEETWTEWRDKAAALIRLGPDGLPL